MYKLILAAAMALMLASCANAPEGMYGSPFIVKADKSKQKSDDDES